jgi:hypothetical protein
VMGVGWAAQSARVMDVSPSEQAPPRSARAPTPPRRT